VRVIAATHQDLEAMVEEGRFRADLYFRLKVFQIRVPALRDRPEDIPGLAAAAVARWNERVSAIPARRWIAGCSDETIELLRGYDWPGNVRELMAAVEHACIVCDGKRDPPCHLPTSATRWSGSPRPARAPSHTPTTDPPRAPPPRPGSARRSRGCASAWRRTPTFRRPRASATSSSR
jgi:DNA-binding NtrC family response regulator